MIQYSNDPSAKKKILQDYKTAKKNSRISLKFSKNFNEAFIVPFVHTVETFNLYHHHPKTPSKYCSNFLFLNV